MAFVRLVFPEIPLQPNLAKLLRFCQSLWTLYAIHSRNLYNSSAQAFQREDRLVQPFVLCYVVLRKSRPFLPHVFSLLNRLSLRLRWIYVGLTTIRRPK